MHNFCRILKLTLCKPQWPSPWVYVTGHPLQWSSLKQLYSSVIARLGTPIIGPVTWLTSWWLTSLSTQTKTLSMLSVLDNSRALYLSIFNFVGFYKDGYLYSCSREVIFYIVHPCLWRALPTILTFTLTLTRGRWITFPLRLLGLIAWSDPLV